MEKLARPDHPSFEEICDGSIATSIATIMVSHWVAHRMALDATIFDGSEGGYEGK